MYLRAAELHDLAVLHDRHPVPERERLVQVVRDEDDRPLDLALDVEKEVLHVAPNQRVERREGLVHEEYLLLGRQGRVRDPTRCFMPPESSVMSLLP